MAPLSKDLDKLDQLKRDEQTARAAYEDIKRSREQWEEHCIERMEAEDVQSMKRDGVQFVMAETTFGNVQDRAEFVAWAEQNDESLVELKERKGLINELVREKLDNGEPLPPGVGYYVRRYISRRAS